MSSGETSSAPDVPNATSSGARPSSVAADGELVIIWGTYAQVTGITLKTGGITNNRYGSYHHDDMIGQPFGCKVRPRRGGDRWLAMLRASPELITQSLVHRTQIIYHADISLLLSLLDAGPGKVIVEAGTGSGSVSSSFGRALRPGGKLHTFEYHEDRQRQAAEDFKRYGMEDVIISRHGDVCATGFPEDLRNAVDGIFLDLPAPWDALPHVDDCLVEGGKICTFSPCIEQIDRTANELRRRRYQGLRMFEILAANWGVKYAGPPAKRRKTPEGGVVPEQPPEYLSFQLPMRGHTGYLMIATKPPSDEP